MSWFQTIGWWQQDIAYERFHEYRRNPVNGNLNHAIEAALPIIRVVFATQKVKVTHAGDEEDLISSAALTITKALPKMARKPVEKIGNDKQYMRYLFTCVIHSFYRELDVLHGKPTKVQRRIDEAGYSTTKKTPIKTVEAKMMVAKLPRYIYLVAKDMVRFSGHRQHICEYILQQLILGREVSKSVLRLLRCKDRCFYINYCTHLLYSSFRVIQTTGTHSLHLLTDTGTAEESPSTFSSFECSDEFSIMENDALFNEEDSWEPQELLTY